jgi:hypothetical protein
MSGKHSKHETTSSDPEPNYGFLPVVSRLLVNGQSELKIKEKVAEEVGPDHSLSPLAWSIDSDSERNRMTASQGIVAIMTSITNRDNRFANFGALLMEVPGIDGSVSENCMLIACLGLSVEPEVVVDLQLKLAEEVNLTLKELGSPLRL